VALAAKKETGLDRDTTVDLMQTRALSAERLTRRLGRLGESEMSEIATAMAVVVEYV
jgi:mRNA-degrading endonuclease toxin of MazEF toxin-antitoxin module